MEGTPAVLTDGCKADVEAGVSMRLVGIAHSALDEYHILDLRALLQISLISLVVILITFLYLQRGSRSVECQFVHTRVLAEHLVHFLLQCLSIAVQGKHFKCQMRRDQRDSLRLVQDYQLVQVAGPYDVQDFARRFVCAVEGEIWFVHGRHRVRLKLVHLNEGAHRTYVFRRRLTLMTVDQSYQRQGLMGEHLLDLEWSCRVRSDRRVELSRACSLSI